MHFRNYIFFFIAAAAGLLQACSSDDAATKPLSSTSGGAGGGSTTGGTTGSTVVGTTGATTTAATTTGAGGTGAGGSAGAGGSTSTDMPSALPFVVDSLFAASGYMGDGDTATHPPAMGVMPILQEIDMSCLATRPVGVPVAGHCHKFTYTPTAIPPGAGGAGVYWQYPANNWGMFPGKRIAQGATKVTFYAAGAVGGENVSFIVGMQTMAMPNTDAAKIEVPIVLTTTMSPYTINFTGTGFTYDAVLGGFAWWIAAPIGSAAPITFTVDNIRWEQ